MMKWSDEQRPYDGGANRLERKQVVKFLRDSSRVVIIIMLTVLFYAAPTGAL